MSTMQTTTMDTPDGAFTIVGTPETVLASGWTDDVTALVALIHPRLRPTTAPSPGDGGAVGLAREAADAYYASDHAAPSAVPVQQRSGPYRERAWEVLREVRPGEPITYAEYALRTGSPAAVRAAASACARNAAALFVPCHRIVRTDGTLGGFRYGLDVKRSLLAREAGSPG